MNLKYEKEIATINSCPPRNCKPETREAFRVVHADFSHPNNFRPSVAINPRRAFPNDEKKCSACALSLFTTRDSVIEFIHSIEKTNPKIRKSLGDHIASGVVQPSDGLLSIPDNHGHFDLFEAAGANLAQRFKTIGAIP